MFIQGLNPDVLAGKHNTCSLLFDMNKLFESWVAAELRPEAWKQNLKLREQGPRRYMAQWQDNEQPVFQMKPDISLIDAEDNVVRICDAKWKILNQEESKLGISQADLYQLQAYGNRYDVKVLDIYYPMQKDLTLGKVLKVNGVHQTTIRIIPVNIADYFETNLEVYGHN
jgi:5-methylcytosine-specific restriction enzyme subunit McrC